MLLEALAELPPDSEGASLVAESLALVSAVEDHKLGLVVRWVGLRRYLMFTLSKMKSAYQ